MVLYNSININLIGGNLIKSVDKLMRYLMEGKLSERDFINLLKEDMSKTIKK